MKKILIQVGLLVVTGICYSQQDAMFTQYMDNQIYVNPGYTGSKECLQAGLLHRQQWVGFKGAPSSTTLSLHTPTKYRSLAIGIDLMNDKIGPIDRLSANIDVAYRLMFKNGSKLSLGLKGGIDSYSGNIKEIDATGQDPLAVNLNNAVSPNFGVGAYYFSNRWFIGASVPRISSNLSKRIGGLDDARHIFAIAGCVLNVSENFKLRPTTQLRLAEGSPMSLDLSLAGIFSDKFWLGGMYRLNESVGGFIQYEFAQQFKIGYAIDVPTNVLRGQTSGSHEVLLTYTLKKSQKGLISPRYF